jgi:hypothetical protein
LLVGVPKNASISSSATTAVWITCKQSMCVSSSSFQSTAILITIEGHETAFNGF